MNVLIIEDDKNFARILTQFLQPIASNVIVAQNMEQALRIVSAAQEIELITVDLGLPDSDVSATVKKQIAALRFAKPNALIIVVTGHDFPDLEKHVITQGADGLIFKQAESFTPKGFLTIVAKIVEKYMKAPQHPNRSIAMLERVSNRIVQYQNAVATS